MLELFKKRLYTIKERLYVEADYLKKVGFGIGQPIKYEIDQINKTVTVLPTDSSKNRVAQTTQRKGKTVPVIDIKTSEIKNFFAQYNQIEIEIYREKIVFTVREKDQAQKIEDNVINFNEIKDNKQKIQYTISASEFARAVNCDVSTLSSLFKIDKRDKGNGNSVKDKAIRLLSLFAGAGTLDKGFLDAGNYNFVFANDRYEQKTLKDYHLQTYRKNIGNHIIMKNVMDFGEMNFPETDLVVAGIPCVAFSPLNSKSNFRSSPDLLHPLVEQTINIIKWSKAKAFLIENVERFITVKNGLMLKRLKERLFDFNIVSKIIDSSKLGSAQRRKRVFVFGLKGNIQPRLDLPHLSEYRTVEDAFKNIENAPQQDLYFEPTVKTLQRIQYIPQGGNIMDVPLHLRAPRKVFSNYCQRLNLRGQAPCISHVYLKTNAHISNAHKNSNLLHLKPYIYKVFCFLLRF